MQGFSYQFSIGKLLVLSLLAGPAAGQAFAQTSASSLNESALPTALVRSVQVVPGGNGPSVEILSTRPLTPTITAVENPWRLVVDLPKSLIASRLRINYRDPQVEAVRVDQFHQDPPTVRVVIDLAQQAHASWDEAGNRLMIRIHPGAPDQARAPSADEHTENIATAYTDGGDGDLVLAGSQVATGSSITAGDDTAVLHVARRGEVRICPGTTVSVTSSPNGREIMLGMSTGSLEAHYPLGTPPNSVLTPDFRILFEGPGEFDYAVSADSRGDTCVRALPGNTASAVVSELMGEGTYQVRPAEQVVFRSGRLATRDQNAPEDCGCPARSTQVLRAAAPRPPTPNEMSPNSGSSAAAPSIPGPSLSSGPETATLPASPSEDIHIQVDAPIVFRASDRRSSALPAGGDNLPLASSHSSDSLEVTALPPPRITSSFLRKIKGFFGTIFR